MPAELDRFGYSTAGRDDSPASKGMAKAAVRNFARSWALDLKGTGICVNVFAAVTRWAPRHKVCRTPQAHALHLSRVELAAEGSTPTLAIACKHRPGTGRSPKREQSAVPNHPHRPVTPRRRSAARNPHEPRFGLGWRTRPPRPPHFPKPGGRFVRRASTTYPFCVDTTLRENHQRQRRYAHSLRERHAARSLAVGGLPRCSLNCRSSRGGHRSPWPGAASLTAR